MGISYVEEIAAAWLKCQGFLVNHNTWFSLPEPRRAWTDIDVLAFKPGELVICSCKSFLGDRKANRYASELAAWFEKAERFLRDDERHRHLVENCQRLRRLVVVDFPGSNRIIGELTARQIEVKLLEQCYKEIVNAIINGWRKRNPRSARRGRKFWMKARTMSWGKEEGMVERLTMALLLWGFLDDRILKLEPVPRWSVFE